MAQEFFVASQIRQQAVDWSYYLVPKNHVCVSDARLYSVPCNVSLCLAIWKLVDWVDCINPSAQYWLWDAMLWTWDMLFEIPPPGAQNRRWHVIWNTTGIINKEILNAIHFLCTITSESYKPHYQRSVTHPVVTKQFFQVGCYLGITFVKHFSYGKCHIRTNSMAFIYKWLFTYLSTTDLLV